MKNRLKYILSPCGTSLITNQADEILRKLVFKYANCKNRSEVPEDDRQKLDGLINKTRQKLEKANYQEVALMSAELHSIIRFYDGVIPQKNGDYHKILCTDTWLGEVTANMVSAWLTKQSVQTIVDRHADLQTSELQSFQSSLSDLVKKLSDEIPRFRDKGYKIVFNLTGGFKSVQGFLQSIANFYADETIYIFEKSEELLRIPRLPVRMDFKESVDKNMNTFRRLSKGLNIDNVGGIPETLLFTMDNEVTLSPWGELVWEQTKKELYQKRIYPSPSRKIHYSKTFIKSVENLPSDRCILINERLDQLAKNLENNPAKSYNPASLDFKQLKGKNGVLTHELDAWPDKDAKRIFGHFEKDVFVLDKLDKALH